MTVDTRRLRELRGIIETQDPCDGPRREYEDLLDDAVRELLDAYDERECLREQVAQWERGAGVVRLGPPVEGANGMVVDVVLIPPGQNDESD